MHNPPIDVLENGDELSRALANRIRRAEKSDQISFGGAILHTEDGKFECEVFIDVTFYPERQWWLNRRGSKDREKLTPELYERVKKLAL